MNKRMAQKEQTREKILDSAYSLFSQRGFMNVNTIDITEEAHVSHGTLFLHFSTRNELVNAVICRFGETVVKRMHTLAETRSSLKGILEAHLDCLKENEFFYSRLLRDLHSLPKNARLQLTCILSAVSHHISLAAQCEIRDKEMPPLPADLLFNTWIGLLHHYLINRELFVVDGSVLEKHGKKLLGHFMKLLTRSNKEV
jgi:AcrR family transcriptional regulator